MMLPKETYFPRKTAAAIARRLWGSHGGLAPSPCLCAAPATGWGVFSSEAAAAIAGDRRPEEGVCSCPRSYCEPNCEQQRPQRWLAGSRQGRRT